jgi:hypothetical protein
VIASVLAAYLDPTKVPKGEGSDKTEKDAA